MSAPAAPALPPAVQAKLDPYLLSALLSQFAHYDDHADGGSTPLVTSCTMLPTEAMPA